MAWTREQKGLQREKFQQWKAKNRASLHSGKGTHSIAQRHYKPNLNLERYVDRLLNSEDGDRRRRDLEEEFAKLKRN